MKRYTQEGIRQAVQTIADAYLSMYETMRDQKTVTIADDTVIQKLRKMGFPRQGRPLDNVVGEMLEDVCTNQALLQHPRFFAFVPSPASPLSWVGDVLTDAYNPHGGTWMESSAASCLEQETIQWLCQQAGYPQTAGGLFVSGGSIANLTALAAARHAMLAETEYSSGVAYLSEQAHFSILKALRIMGLTKEQIHMIPCDDSLRMDVLQLEQAILQDKKAGKKPFLVVATAGTTNTGCIDPLSRIADICQIHRLWFYVDGAYGASALVSKNTATCWRMSHGRTAWYGMPTNGCSKRMPAVRSCFVTGNTWQAFTALTRNISGMPPQRTERSTIGNGALN